MRSVALGGLILIDMILIDKKRGLLQVVATRISVERVHKLYLAYPDGFCAQKSDLA
jgi:hypothetical protein